MATARHRRWWASTARLWPRRSGSAARGTEREQISLVAVADASFRTQLSMDETTPAPPSTGMGSSARSCGRPRLPSSGDRGRSDDCRSCRSRGNACCGSARAGQRCVLPPRAVDLRLLGRAPPRHGRRLNAALLETGIRSYPGVEPKCCAAELHPLLRARRLIADRERWNDAPRKRWRRLSLSSSRASASATGPHRWRRRASTWTP